MSRSVFWTRRALKDLERTSLSERERIEMAINDFATFDRGDVRRLVNVDPPRFRLRVGTWRVILTLEHPTIHQVSWSSSASCRATRPIDSALVSATRVFHAERS